LCLRDTIIYLASAYVSFCPPLSAKRTAVPMRLKVSFVMALTQGV
jgi:hypothetical protein